MASHYKETVYGFEWGAAAIERVCSDEKWGVLLVVRGKRETVEVRVTPSGLLRVGKVAKTVKGPDNA